MGEKAEVCGIRQKCAVSGRNVRYKNEIYGIKPKG